VLSYAALAMWPVVWGLRHFYLTREKCTCVAT
jgi:hypothetical protein